MIHVRYQGASYDIENQELDVGSLTTDAQIKEAVARHLKIEVVQLTEFQVDREGENLTVRPSAVFG